jgi:nicotinamidase-related amidase
MMATKKGPADPILDGYRSKGFAGRVGFGRRPAVLVVDFIVGFTDPESPLAGELDSQIEATCALLETARSRSLPVFFTTTVYDSDWSNGGLFVVKIPSLKILVPGSRWIEVDPRLERQPSEPIIEKQYASAFFGTSLASTLTARGIDTVIVAGCTTSGCVRATVVDSLQHGFRTIVPPECVGDRSAEQHAANLVDIEGKYGDVVELVEVVAVLERGEGSP